MATLVGVDNLGEKQRAILEAALRNPKLSNAEIADRTGARIALVRDTRSAYEDEISLSDLDTGSVSEPEHAGVTESDPADATESLSKTQLAILEVAADNPTLTNAEIAERTGARIALVRDTRSEHDHEGGFEYGVVTESTPTSGDAADESPAAAEVDRDEPTEVQSRILEAAAANPELTNAEIAERVGARITLVRDTRSAYEGEGVPGAHPDTESCDDSAEVTEGGDKVKAAEGGDRNEATADDETASESVADGDVGGDADSADAPAAGIPTGRLIALVVLLVLVLGIAAIAL